MSLIARLFGGAAEGIVGAAEGVAGIIDRFVETDDEKRFAEGLKAKMLARPGELQVELNKIEAGHRTVWVAGWRPAIGWVGAVSLAAYYIPQYLLAAYIWSVQSLELGHIVPYPATPDGLLELVLGMLGLGGMRTFEKLAGKAR